jgi:hydrogenase maturation protein HypF
VASALTQPLQGWQVGRRIRVTGQVQGVGFRPFVYRLATELAVGGWVRNDAHGVDIEVHGNREAVEALIQRLVCEAPPLARIDAVTHGPTAARPGLRRFVIEESVSGAVTTAVTPDATVCGDCLGELFDPRNRRYRYPFINCTHCGPRYTITGALPYDRPNTSMAPFALCSDCRAEYQAPEHRRFHAQPNACPVCGPRLALHDADGAPLIGVDPVGEAVARIQAGQIVALKGLGGFHLVCDARAPDTVDRLRRRKDREEKPFAVMMLNGVCAESYTELGAEEGACLRRAERPVVLLRKRPACDSAFPGIAPGLAWLGVMLPYSPLHYLLFHEAVGRPTGTDWLQEPHPWVLVCTSANPGGEPLVSGNHEAFRRLAGIADGFVVHDRDILVRCDDSVVRRSSRGTSFIRRARGYTPQAIRLPRGGPPILACGGRYKNTVCLTRGDQAYVSQHVGDLDNAATCRALDETVHHLMAVLEVVPERVACDLHPDFYSSRFAAGFAAEHGLPVTAVQHHHAHLAAVMAESGLTAPAIGLALDGVGFGSDGALWGGELLRAEQRGFRRLGHLRHLPLPGGDRAAREPWRMGAAALFTLGLGTEITERFPYPGAPALGEMLAKGVQCPLTSSAGRLFDAAAGLLGIKPVMRFEGQAAMLLEGLAEHYGSVAAASEGYALHPDGSLDLLPLLRRLADERDPERGAALFHATLAAALADWTVRAAEAERLRDVLLAGGCFLNHVLTEALCARLADAGLRVHTAARLPPNDGGLSLGQAWVAMGDAA